MDIWVGFLKIAFFVDTFVWQKKRFSPSVNFGDILDNEFVFKLYLIVPNLIVECNNLSISGLWSKICQSHPEISQLFCRNSCKNAISWKIVKMIFFLNWKIYNIASSNPNEVKDQNYTKLT
jgi:hypothetical protein